MIIINKHNDDPFPWLITPPLLAASGSRRVGQPPPLRAASDAPVPESPSDRRGTLEGIPRKGYFQVT